jgi:hypothetical protein
MLTEEDRALLDLYNEIADSPELYLEMDLEPGDIQLLSNHTVLHARTGFEDFREADRRRHLLRLWVSIPSREPLATRLRTQRSRLRMAAIAVRLKVEHALRRTVAG